MAAHLHHLALGARDVVGLAAFYRDVLGMKEVARHDEPNGESLRSVWLELGGGAVLMIEKTDQPQPQAIDGHGAGLFLLALHCDAESLETRCNELRERDFQQERATDFSRYFRDPEGNRFALSCYELPE